MKITFAACLAAAMLLSGCYESGTNVTGDVDGREDTINPDSDDDVYDPVDLPDLVDPDVPPDTDCDQIECVDCTCTCPDGTRVTLWSDCYSVCDPIPACPAECPPDACAGCEEPPECPTGPAQGVLGGPCTRSGDCEMGADCYSETYENFDGETYVYWQGGSCVLSGAGSDGCDPLLPSTCPDGSVCIYLGTYMGYEWHGCFDACTPADPSDVPYDWACGCREGYACNLAAGACFPGCSNDRECCELWSDTNADGRRSPGEVTFYPDCEGTCDNDMGWDCQATYECVYPGNPDAVIGDPCEHDYQCTPGGTCLSALYTDPVTGDPYYPGGYCTAMDCQYVGRGCTDRGGVCANMGGEGYTSYMCVKPCDVGTSPETPGYKCRGTPLDEAQACRPVWPGTFIEDTPSGEDGFCWYGNFPGGSKTLGETCRGDGECASPFGLGSCIDYFGSPWFCTVSCSETLVNENTICGGADSEGVATGVCTWNMCWQGCPDLDAPQGENGCAGEDMACTPLYVSGSVTYVPEGASRPQGLCMPACSSDEWCRTYFGPSRSCDPDTHACR